MVKRSSKVLSMVMAFTMFASLFVAPNTFAAFDAQASKKANVSTYFIEKNKDGVYNKQTAYAAGSPFGTIAYSDGEGEAIPDPTAGNSFVVGETYNIKIEQTKDQAANYKLSDAKLAVKLESAAANFYDRYTEEITLKETKASNGAMTYEGSFTALGSADKVTVNDASALEVYIDLERTNARAAKAVANDQTAATTNNKYKVEPLNDDGTVASSVVLQEEKDVYFKVTPSSGRYIAGATVADRQNNITVFAAKKAAPSNDLNTTGFTGGQVTVTSAAAEKGLNVYKISGENVTRLIRAVGNEGTIKLNVTTEAVGTTFKVKNNVNNYNLLDAAGTKLNGNETLVPAGTELQIQGTTQTNKKITGVTFNNGATASPATVNDIETYIDQGKWTVKFIVPTAPAATNMLNISAVTTADVASKKLSIDGGALANKVSFGNTFEVSAQSGSTQTIKFLPRENYAFPETYLEKYFADLPTDNDWKFDFVDLQSGALVYNVTFGTEDLALEDDGVEDPFVPSTTQSFIPAVDFDQVLDPEHPENGLVRFATIGDSGVVKLKNNADVVLSYDSDVAKINKVTLSGTSKSGTGINATAAEGIGTATSQFNLTAKNGLLLSVDSAYAKGGINISDTTNGKIFASSSITGTPVIDRAQVNTVVYLKASPDKGYKLDVIKAYETDHKDTSIVKVEKTDIANTYKLTMPNRDVAGDFGSSVTVEATFVKDTSLVEIRNLIPEADKAKNNGYAVISGDNYLAAGKEFVVEFIANKDYKFVEASAQYKDTKGETKNLAATKTEGNKYTYTVPTDVNAEALTIGITAIFKDAKSITIKSEAAEGGKITDLANFAEAGKEVSFKVTANEGYELDKVSVVYTEKDKENQAIECKLADGTYKFTIPATLKAEANEIVVSATFKKTADKPDTTKNGWIKDDTNWTYWKDGKQVTGWINDGGKEWFYCDVKTGAMKTGWFQDGGSTWYYCFNAEDASQRGNREGAMAANQWVLTNGKWYYLNASGAMETSKWVKDSDDARWAWVGADGAWLYDE